MGYTGGCWWAAPPDGYFAPLFPSWQTGKDVRLGFMAMGAGGEPGPALSLQSPHAPPLPPGQGRPCRRRSRAPLPAAYSFPYSFSVYLADVQIRYNGEKRELGICSQKIFKLVNQESFYYVSRVPAATIHPDK